MQHEVWDIKSRKNIQIITKLIRITTEWDFGENNTWND